MYKHLLVPLDGSRFSEMVIPYASQIARGLEVPLVMLHAVDPGAAHAPAVEREHTPITSEDYSPEYRQAVETTLPSWQPEHYIFLDQMINNEKAAAEAYLLGLATTLEQQGVAVERVVEVGRAAETILRLAEERDGALIAMATHGRSGVQRWAMGSVADRVLHGTQAPAIFIRPQEGSKAQAQIGNLVVPLDGSPLSEGVLPLAIELAKALQLPLHLVEVVPTGTELYMGAEPHAYPSDLLPRMEAESARYLDDVRERLAKEGVRADAKVTTGPPEDGIMSCALEDSLIVMATHGRSGVRRLVLGSVADKVVRLSGRPVLLVRPGDGG